MIRDDAPPPPDLPDVWDGAEMVEKPPEDDAASLGDIYASAPIPEEEKAIPAPPVHRSVREKEPYSPILTITNHVVIPAATITMMVALLFFLYDVRAVFLPGSAILKWVGICFASATVLIARYSRQIGEEGNTTFYTLALAVATIFTIWMSPWDAPGVGALGAFSNAAIILIVWRYATKLTDRLSADLDRPPPDPPRLYGLERLEMEAFQRQRKDLKISVYEIGLRSAKLRDTWRADGEAATRQIVMLVLIALVGVAIAEPILLAGAPEIAGRALGAVIVFLFAAGIVISAAASTRDQQRLRALGSEAGTGSLSARLALAAVLIMALLTSALALPGVQTPRGSGEIQQRRADQSVSGEGGEENSNTEESIERVEDPNADEPLFDPPPAQSRPAPSWVQSLTGLGQWLRWPVLGAVVLLTLFGLWRLGPGLLKGLKGSFAGLFSSLRKRLRKSPRKQRSDPFARLPHLSQMEPREAVLEAYGIWLGACAHLGHAREEKQTPIEFLTAVPRHLAPLRPIGEKLTRFYTAAAYAGREINDATAAASRQAAEELQLAFSQLETAASSTASRKPS